MDEDITCPFCGVSSAEPIAIQLHIEEQHTEDSPSVVANGSLKPHKEPVNSEQPMTSSEWTRCTRPGCGEYVHLADIDEHLEMHLIGSSSEITLARAARRPLSPARQAALTKSVLRKPQMSAPNPVGPKRSSYSLLDYFGGTSYHSQSRPTRHQGPRRPGRLGKRELGPYAFEEAMPRDVRLRLVEGAAPHRVNRIGSDGKLAQALVVPNETSGLVPVIADLCALDTTIAVAYLCHSSVKHVHKIQCDGNFCGYWNIQMMLSFLQASQHPGHVGPLPNVLQLQETIEQAWSNGICSYGRVETGGINGTRKWIGTSEALAYFSQIGVRVEALSFKDDDSSHDLAVVSMLDYVEAYFMGGLDVAKHQGTSHVTQLAPLYFQRLGHSMTVVGLERKKEGSRSLLLYDPSFATLDAMKRLAAGLRSTAAPEALLKPYRRSDRSLARFDEFELILSSPTRPD